MSETFDNGTPASLMQMQNILCYIVHSNHHTFINMMISNSIGNVREHYQHYASLQKKFDMILQRIQNPCFSYTHKVVLFFFLLSCDRRMRHWILASQQSKEYACLQAEALKKNIEMSPNHNVVNPTSVKNPFLGQNVCFQALLPASAVSILLAISKESFFEAIVINEQQITSVLDEIFTNIRELVLLS